MRFIKKIAPFAVIIAAALLLLYLPDTGPERTKDLGSFFRSELRRQAYCGYAVAVVKDGSVLYVDAFGNDGLGKPLSPETPFLLGAASKTFTGLVTLSLAREGLVSIDRPVIEYLPWFAIGAGGPAAGGTPMTLRHLLSHTSGVSDRAFDDLHPAAPDLESAVRGFALALPKEAPGLHERYLDTDYQVTGLVLEAATKVAFADLVSSRILNPLGMTRSSARPDKVAGALPAGSGCFFGANLPRKQAIPAFGAPSGYIVSTAQDMSAYLAYLTGPERLPRTPVPARDMHILFEPLLPSSHYSYGWHIEGSGKELMASRVGSLDGFSASLVLWPGKRDGIVILAPQNSLLQSLVALPSLVEGARRIVMDGQADRLFPLVRFYILLAVAAAVHLLALTFQIAGAISWARDVRGRSEASGSASPLRFGAFLAWAGIVFRVALLALVPTLLSLAFSRQLTWAAAFSFEPGLAAWFVVASAMGLLRNAARLAWLRGSR
jgi:CubicO group peptidase (beta-lactamase class C family)